MTGRTPEHEVMDSFAEVAELLFGDGADELVRKMNPTSPDLSTQKKREQTQARVGLASNVVGIGAGLAGTVEATNRFREVRRVKRGVKVAAKVPSKFKTKYAVGLAGAGLGLQAANLAGDAVANRVLARSAKADPKRVAKSKNEYSSAPTVSRGQLVVMGTKKAKPVLVDTARKVKDEVQKSNDLNIVWEGEFAKFDADKRQVFGWASIVEVNGEPVIDLQGDYISADEIEKAAYEYVQKSRKGGDMHRRNGEEAFHASEMIESFMVTPEKVEKMGLPAGSLPTGWWVGYQVHDDDTWNLVKSGKRTGFSIHGRGKRVEQ